MASKRVWSGIGLVAATALALAACGGGDGGEDGGRSITVGFPGTLGPGDVPIVTALDVMEADGWDVSYVEFDSPDVQTQALMGNDIQVAAMGPATVMAANENGAELQMVGNNMMLDYFVVGSADVAECGDLDGRTVAYHSEGSTSTAHLRRYLAEVCPEASPEFLVISGSANRITALVNGQIDGTIVRVEDWYAENVDTSVAHIIDNLTETQAELLAHTVVVDGSRLDSTQESIEAFLAAFDTALGEVNDDPAAYAERAAEILGATTEEMVPVYEGLVELELFPRTHDLDPAHIDATLAFYVESDTISEGLSPEDVANFDLGGGQ